jgi:hypothetical protein
LFQLAQVRQTKAKSQLGSWKKTTTIGSKEYSVPQASTNKRTIRPRKTPKSQKYVRNSDYVDDEQEEEAKEDDDQMPDAGEDRIAKRMRSTRRRRRRRRRRISGW